MEVSNRFELLAALPVHEKPIEDLSIDVTTAEQQKNIDEENSTKSQWDIPEYVEKFIPSAPVLTLKEKTTPPIKKVKPSSVNINKCEEQQDEVDIEVQNQPTTYSYYPPQPYKFKQTPTNRANQAIPKFNRKMNVLPKHTVARGNSKASTHQI